MKKSESIEEQIGWRIRKLREGKKVTLSVLGKKTGLSTSLLSKIENGKVASPVSTLSQIANSLNVGLNFLLDENQDQQDRKYVMVRKGEGIRLDRGTEDFGLIYEMLAQQKLNKLMNPSILILENKREIPVLFTHPGEEIIFVLQGKMEFTYGKEKLRMQAGDFLYFDADRPHGGRNIGRGPLKVLMVICDG